MLRIYAVRTVIGIIKYIIILIPNVTCIINVQRNNKLFGERYSISHYYYFFKISIGGLYHSSSGSSAHTCNCGIDAADTIILKPVWS